MTNAEWKCLEAYVRDVADDMGLRDWRITLCRTPAMPDARAQMDSTEGRKSVSIWFAWDFREHEREQQRHAVVHELVHVHFDPAWKYAERVMHQEQYVAYSIMSEYGVDGIADLLAPQFDLINWPATAKPTAKPKAKRAARTQRTR